MLKKYLWMAHLNVAWSISLSCTLFMGIKMEIMCPWFSRYWMVKASVYSKCFFSIMNLFLQKGLHWNPSALHVDFDHSVMKVFDELFPNSQLKCYRFHLAQVWWRKIQNISLANKYKDKESEIGKWLKKFFVIPFLQPCEVSDAFVKTWYRKHLPIKNALSLLII